MRRILVNLRAVLGVVVIVALVGVALLFSVSTQHMGTFSGVITAEVNDAFDIVNTTGMVVSDIPSSAHVAPHGVSLVGSAEVGVEVYTGFEPNGFNADTCFVGFSSSGSCGWTASGQSYTIAIQEGGRCPGCSDNVNYTAPVYLMGWLVETAATY